MSEIERLAAAVIRHAKGVHDILVIGDGYGYGYGDDDGTVTRSKRRRRS